MYGRSKRAEEWIKEGETGMNFNEEALKLHAEHRGKIEVVSKVPVKTRDDLSTAYTPGVAEPCREIHKNKRKFTNTLQKEILWQL